MLKEVIRGNTASEVIDFVLETCCNCGIPFMMPAYHRKRLLENKGESFYCPNGHSQHYIGKTKAQKLQEELDRLKKVKDEEETRLWKLYMAELENSKSLERKLKRVHKGLCPCCNRSFVNLERHMKTKHPEIIKKGEK